MVPQPALEPLRRWDPDRVGPYVLLGRLGVGAMGQVYLGRSTAGRLVAVKTIKIELADEAGFRSRFAHEVAAARRVSGVFTAAVVAADPEADLPWLATAYVPAPSLSALVAGCGPLPVPAVRWLAAGCAEALESIHSAGLVHRDLKPSNVLVSPDGPRVIDFGVARAAERIQLTVTRGAVGTPAYMAPEQARDTRQASVASDVFSLGATLAFAATGHPPYQGETVMDVLVRLATEPPDLTGLPAELADLVASCLARSPRERPTSAALLDQLGPFVGSPAGPGDGHAYLPTSALALIAGYQRGPAPVGRPADEASAGDTGETTSNGTDDGTGDDATFGSHVALPVTPPTRRWKGRPRRPQQLPRRDPPPGPGQPRTRQPRTGGGAGPRPGPRWRGHPVLAATGLAGAAAVLVAGGAVLGSTLAGPGTGNGPASTLGLPNPPPGPPPSAFPTLPAGPPAIVLLQPVGDQHTEFLIHGTGWTPLSRVTVAVAGHGRSPLRPVVDRLGTFNYAINQTHEFFAGPIPPGVYQVLATGPGGQQARASFQVYPPPPPGAPPTP